MQIIKERPADSAGELLSGLAIQQRARQTSLQRLARLRKEASAEIHRLIAFLDASDPYVMTEREDEADAGPCDTDELEQDLASPDPRTSGDYLGRSPWMARTFDQSRFQGADAEADYSDDEPSLGLLERVDQGEGLAYGFGNDLEGEHDGAEPGEDAEPSLGALEGHTDQRAAWHVASVNDYELDHSETGIGDLDGLLEQVGTQDWQHGVMA
ncbi:hypothetical protein BSZ19_46890 [Bradyrhizobium japonicum]|uniref:Uncharacterized protein n=1 Tax=Bradyrhizobium japonicum TaxID=375 RepID=A0A1Y2J7M4_BRAJP|nr:hypothetical protein [Bradyrhizobium japonicum]OSJ22121.1 hypothetical protein BSZ19_46890 [Bradyrhizobium japonicum]